MGENYETDDIAELEQEVSAVFNPIHDDASGSEDGATTNHAFQTNNYLNTSELNYSSSSSTSRECGVISSCIIL